MSTPSLLNIPYVIKAGTLYSQIPETGAGDFVVTRATTPTANRSTRINANGFIELVNDNVPRLDYPLGGAVNGCASLLVEPSAANGILNSQDTATNWNLGANLTSGYVDVIGVSGNDLTVAFSGSGIGSAPGRLARFANNVALASGSTYTISFLMRQTGTHTIGGYYAAITGAAAGDLGGGFDVSGSFSSGSLFAYTGATSRIRRVERFGTNVYRCSETFTMTASGTLTAFSLGPIVSVVSNNNSAVGTQIAFAAPQIELGAIPTSFIPTTTQAITRGADVISKTGVSSLIGQTEGTIYAEVDYRNFSTSSQAILHLFENSQNLIGIQVVSIGAINQFQAYAFVANSLVVSITSTISTAGVYKIALAYKLNDYALYINGTPIGTDSSAGVPTTSQVLLGHYASQVQLNNRIRAVAIYPNRLSNSELATLTTP